MTDPNRIAEIKARLIGVSDMHEPLVMSYSDRYAGEVYDLLTEENGAECLEGVLKECVEFYANAHLDIPFLLAEVERLQALIDGARVCETCGGRGTTLMPLADFCEGHDDACPSCNGRGVRMGDAE